MGVIILGKLKLYNQSVRRFSESFCHWLGIFFLFWISGCATQAPRRPEKNSPSPTLVVASRKAQEMIVFVPQTDEGAAAWIKLYARHPSLRMVIAMSPRFKHFDGDPVLKSQILALQKSGRLELALQLPNAPFLPLIVDTNGAKEALPSRSPLPSPAFAYPDDVIQMVARAKADFYRTWKALPHGLVLPLGAASPPLLSMFDRLGFAWLVAALEASSVDGVYKAGSLTLWDATPAASTTGGTVVHVWDERIMKEKGTQPLEAWASAAEKSTVPLILPSDPDLPAASLPADNLWRRRTWLTPDWTLWIGNPAKNAAWTSLLKTREALEAYKNSGTASVQRLDMAFEEIYTAENSNFFLSIGNEALPVNVAEDREHDFKATLSAVYRLINRPPPDDLFATPSLGEGLHTSSTTFIAETLPDSTDHIHIEDAANDDHGDGHLPEPPAAHVPGSYDLRSVDVVASSSTIQWTIGMTALSNPPLGSSRNPGPFLDIYIDLNHQSGVGTPTYLPGRGLSLEASDAWEYVLCLRGSSALLYRTHNGGTYEASATFPLAFDGPNNIRLSLPREVMRGSPKRWGYQVLVMDYDQRSPETNPQPLHPGGNNNKIPPVYDFIDPFESTQAELLADIAEGKRENVPFVRARQAK
jgi:hypothetical protein